MTNKEKLEAIIKRLTDDGLTFNGRLILQIALSEDGEIVRIETAKELEHLPVKDFLSRYGMFMV